MNFTHFLKNNTDEYLLENESKMLIPITHDFTPAVMLYDFYELYGTNSWNNKDSRNMKKKYLSSRTSYQLQDKLVKWKYLLRDGDNFSITQKGLDYLKTYSIDDKSTEPDEDDSVAKGTRDITQLKKKRFKVPKPGKNSKYLSQMQTILSHMKSFGSGATKTTFMLAGDPGTGKTSFIKSVSDLTGVPLVIIEAPHITQEHIINIPFLVLDGQKEHKGNVTVDTSNDGMKVVQAESNLVTILKSKKRRTEQQIQAHINRSKPLRDIQPKLQKRIDKVSSQYNSILFLDEFYRTSSVKIRNVLRNILNGKIGNDKIPKGVYIVMATNINDDGVEDIPLNQDFHIMDYDVSSKEDFMNYMYGKYVDNPDDYENEEDYKADSPATSSGVAIKENVWNAFMDNLNDRDLGMNDEDADVRFSPRRLEQLILYVNEALPVNSQDDANALLSFIKNNFTNYLTGDSMNELKDKMMDIVKSLIVEDSNINIDALRTLPDIEWKQQLTHELDMKMKLGETRSYIPVVSGLPGIGKTTVFKDISRENGMGFIQVDVSNLTPEDIIGMPIADTSNGDENITTSFSEPNLYITIMKEYNDIIDEYRKPGRAYNIVLLFDELNRTEVPVFNAIRQVLLEKKFSDNVRLPEDILITGAINPVDIGAIEFTSHTRDVLDIIPSAQSSSKLFDYIKTKPELVKISNEVGFNLLESVTKCMQSLVEDFKTEHDNEDNILQYEEQAFWWTVDGVTFYVSGREITEAIALAVSQTEDSLDDMGWDKTKNFKEAQYDKFIKEAVTVTANSFNATLKMVALKQDVPDFSKKLGLKITTNSKYSSFFNNIKSIKGESEISLNEILTSANDDIQYLDKGVLGTYLKYTQPSEFNQDFTNITHRFMAKGLTLEVFDKIMDLSLRINKSLRANNTIKNDYLDVFKVNSKSILKAMMIEDEFDLIGLMEDKTLLAKLGKFNEIQDN